MLLFSLAGQRFGLEFGHLRELLPFEAVTGVPTLPPLFAGVVVVRSELVALVDLALLWGGNPTDLSAVSRVLVLGGDRAEFAVLAEAADELETIEEQSLGAVPGNFQHCPFARGATREGVIVLDGSALLKDKRIYA